MRHATRIDMVEVTRLTREGRLGEAMALLRGEAPAPAAAPDTRVDRPSPTLGMTRPRNGPWSPDPEPQRTSSARPSVPRTGSAGGTSSSRPERPASTAVRRPFGDAARGPSRVADGPRFTERTHNGPAGTLAYKLFVPGSYEDTGAPVPLLVMLHGCTQSPDDFAAGTRMNELAQEMGFLVVYPAQSQRANGHRCWNWFQPADQQRDRGEPALIAGIVNDVMRSHSVDPSRVYAAGLSAGGAAAAILGQRHPDLFAAIGIHSGLACGAAGDLSSAFAAMQGRAPQRSAPGAHPIPTIVFHGDADRTVAPVNGERVLEQAMAGGAGASTVESARSPGGVAYTRTTHVLADGARPVRFENWVLHGAGHAWSGGDAQGSFTDPNGPDASREMLRFFAEASHH